MTTLRLRRARVLVRDHVRDHDAFSPHVFVTPAGRPPRHGATGPAPVALGHSHQAVAQQLLDQQLLSRPDPAGLGADGSPHAAACGAFEPEPDL